MSQCRQLAAIMFADIMGYTALMQEDEAMAMQFRHKLKTKLEEETSTHQGRILEFRGDGAMCSFTSSIEGVRAALALQLNMQTDPIVPLRIGMHTGDVIFEENYIYGDGVNIASRMESFAVPGGIFISAKVYDDIKNQKDIQAVSLGKYALKNVKEQVEIFAISNPGIKIPESNSVEGKGERVAEKNSDEKSIAVLAFVNMSSDPEQEYFSDGMAEEIVNSLSHVKDLKVAGRTSSFHFKGKNTDLREVGEKLHVRTVLEGSVRKQGNRLRITAQLINVEDGYHLWSEKYDREMSDIFAIQDEIAFAITEQLKITLLEKEKALINKNPTEDHEAYDLYLRGRFYLNKRGVGIRKGLQYFQQAVEIDPAFALAYTGMADVFCILALYSTIPAHQGMPKAREYAEKAIKFDPTLVEAHSALAFINTFYDWDWAEAKKRFWLVFEMNPGYAPAHYWYSYYLSFVERKYEEAIQEARKSKILEPLVPVPHHILSMMQINAGKFKEALQSSQTAIDLDGGFFPAFRSLGLSLVGLNRYPEAIEALQTAVSLSSRLALPLVELCWVYSLAGNIPESQKILDEFIQRSATEFISSMFLCCVAYFSQNHDKAIEYIKQAYDQRDSQFPCIKVYALFSFFRDDPRFQPFIKRMNFPE